MGGEEVVAYSVRGEVLYTYTHIYIWIVGDLGSVCGLYGAIEVWAPHHTILWCRHAECPRLSPVQPQCARATHTAADGRDDDTATTTTTTTTTTECV